MSEMLLHPVEKLKQSKVLLFVELVTVRITLVVVAVTFSTLCVIQSQVIFILLN